MEGGNTTVRLFVTSAVLQRLVTFEFRLERRIRRPVGAGLLAKAVYQSTSALTDTPPSRASPLPQSSAAFRTSSSEQGTPLS
ncbi:hypothetical protein E3W21_21595 [Pseudomonas sp. F01002]|nr:hypothetical protein E3W21_21595 [Pseudomonas sp. F01002]